MCNALRVIGAEFEVGAEPAALERASAILLPGVGHFAQMVRALEAVGLTEPLRRRLRAGVPYLGICLGMQALFAGSEEAPEAAGLGLLAGRVQRFPPPGRVPHMGWAAVQPLPGARLARPGMYYFAHSYYLPEGSEGGAALARHGLPFLAAIERGNLAGCQFHPEKSGPAGLDFLQRWVRQCPQSE